jgi:hypothetical protein
MGSTQAGAWDAVEKSIASCMGCNTTESGAPWKWVCPPGGAAALGMSGSLEEILSWKFFRVSNALMFTMYSALATIVLAVIWYVTRPNGHSGAQPRDRLHFRKWWFRGRFLLLCICLFSLFSIITVRFAGGTFRARARAIGRPPPSRENPLRAGVLTHPLLPPAHPPLQVCYLSNLYFVDLTGVRGKGNLSPSSAERPHTLTPAPLAPSPVAPQPSSLFCKQQKDRGDRVFSLAMAFAGLAVIMLAVMI